MKPQVLHRVISQNYFVKHRYGKYSITENPVESWNKIQKQFKDMLLKDLSPRKMKTIVSNFYLNHISSSMIMQK